MKKKMLAALVSATILCGSVQVSASSNFFADVPTDDWSYGAVNELIDTGKIEGYTEKIPDGRIMSRIEMAMIIVEAQENISAFSKKDQKIINQLAKEYLEDVDYEVIDAEEDADRVNRYGVMQAPTLVIVDDGKVSKYVNASNIKRYVDQVGGAG